ncbi:MAG TPA: polysaccharide deacetylase family protein [Bacteroidota bacterium]|nr:polysaccharide deacetylase family protein [Bacteroidota bacterium]
MDFSARLFRLFVPSAVYEMDDGHVHLTFDDGPHPTATPEVLAELRRAGVRATFFVTGARVRELPDIARRVIQDGHSIGNHAFHHRNLFFQSSVHVRREVEECNQAVFDATGFTPTLFRPPFGYAHERLAGVVRSMGMRIVQWSHDVRDFTGKVDADSMHRVALRTRNGAILLLHDNDATATLVHSYVPLIIRLLRERGFTFSALD